MSKQQSPRSRVVKSDRFDASGMQGTALDFQDLQEQGEQYLAQVRKKSESVVTEARSRIAEERAKALEQARAEGHRLGLQDAEKKIGELADQRMREALDHRMGEMIAVVEAFIDGLENEREHWVAVWEIEAVQLAVGMAERILGRELAASPGIPTEMLRTGLELVSGQTELQIRAHPLDLELLGDARQALINACSRSADVQLVPDSTIERGGCVIETRAGMIDTQPSVQLERMTEELLGNSED